MLNNLGNYDGSENRRLLLGQVSDAMEAHEVFEMLMGDQVI